MNKTEALEKAAQAWCKPSTSEKTMDKELAEEFANILMECTPEPAKGRILAADRVKLATRTEAPVTAEMIERFSEPETIRLLHGIIGLVTEVGEKMDQLKRHLFYGKPLDTVNMKEELGDLDWYMNLICAVLKTNMQEIEEANIKKLVGGRYKDKFSQDEALIRNLVNERKILEENFADKEASRTQYEYKRQNPDDPMFGEKNKQHQSRE